MCWDERGKGIEYDVVVREELADVLLFEQMGWVGEGRGRVCIEAWGGLDEGKYEFELVGSSVLFGSVSNASFSFLLSSDAPARSFSRQIDCDPSLWDSSSLYGIQTDPSFPPSFPPSLRSVPLTITAKALSPCPQNGMTKEILSSGNISWMFTDPVPEGLVESNANDWAQGVHFVIPPSILLDRKAFPPGESVGMKVVAELDDEIAFVADTAITFLNSPVEMVVGEDFKSMIKRNDLLILDFGNSYTLDGILVNGEDEWVWEWEWSCIIPGQAGEEGRECVYADGEEVVMPGNEEWRFEGEEGKEFEVGVPLYFFVRGRVMEGSGGGVVADGVWSEVVNVLDGDREELELVEDRWACGDGSFGFMVSNFCLFCYLFYCSLRLSCFFIFVAEGLIQ